MKLRNVHFMAASEQTAEAPAMPRLRRVTNSPAQEYQARPGQVERLPDSLAAIILARQRMATVRRDEVCFTEDGVDHKFFAHDSVTCRTKDGQRVVVCYNRHDLSAIHILGSDGEYIETLQRKGKQEFFNAETSGRELAKHRAAQQRMVERMEQVHGKDTMQQLVEARENTEAMRRVVTTLPAAAAAAEPAAPANPARGPQRAQRVAEALQRGGARPGAAADRTKDDTAQLWAKKRTRQTTAVPV